MSKTYQIKPNHCDCHPETCCCNPWKVISPQGDTVATIFNKKDAESLVEKLNKADALWGD